jgi:hypothetical protein
VRGAVAVILLWGLIGSRVERTMRILPTLRFGQTLAAADHPTGRVCVVVPAYNEARVIGGLVASLRAETYEQVRFVLALDRCTDETAVLARAAIGGDQRFEIVEIDACPSDWAGKVHAVHAGVTRSRGAADADFLLFADADTLFSPGCIASALALMRERKLDLLSLLSTLTHDTWFEHVVQTAAALELMLHFPLTRVNGVDGRRRAFANGQFMLFPPRHLRRNRRPRGRQRCAARGPGARAACRRRHPPARRLHRRRPFPLPDVCQLAAVPARLEADLHGSGQPARKAALGVERPLSRLGTLLPLWMLAAFPLGLLIESRDAVRGWTVIGLALVAFAVWLAALVRITALAARAVVDRAAAPRRSWLTADLLNEAARDVRTRTPTSGAGVNTTSAPTRPEGWSVDGA